jgi:hypothetical protein
MSLANLLVDGFEILLVLIGHRLDRATFRPEVILPIRFIETFRNICFEAERACEALLSLLVENQGFYQASG